MGWTTNYEWNTKKDVMNNILSYDKKSNIHSRGVKEGMLLIWKGQDEETHGTLYLIEKDKNIFSYKEVSIWECATLNNKELKLLDNEYYQEEIKRYRKKREEEKATKEKLKNVIENMEENKFYNIYTKKGNCIKLQFIFKIKNKIYFDKGYLSLKDIKNVVGVE